MKLWRNFFLRVIYFTRVVFDLLVLLVLVLVNIAFVTLLERKILGYSQRRIGPNKPSFIGFLQPMADAVKLFLKNFFSPNKTHKWLFLVRPRARLFLVLWVWLIVPLEFETRFFSFSAILILVILSLNVYPLLLRGWGSRNKYSILGSLRSVAQTISYEIRLALILMILLIYRRFLRFDFSNKFKLYYGLLVVSPCIFSLWLISSLAETNRTPFDFAEGESELVSGFNTEYSSGGFAVIFMAEYGRIYFLAIITRTIFSFSLKYFIMRLWATFLVFYWVWARTTFPRYRYDLLINLAWKSILPVVLSFAFFSISLITN